MKEKKLKDRKNYKQIDKDNKQKRLTQCHLFEAVIIKIECRVDKLHYTHLVHFLKVLGRKIKKKKLKSVPFD